MNDDFGLTLREFSEGRTQPDMAKLLGVSQGAISQMINSERDIRVRAKESGGYEAIEIRLVGSRRRKSA